MTRQAKAAGNGTVPPAEGGQASRSLLARARYLTPGELSDDGRVVVRESSSRSEEFYRDRWRHTAPWIFRLHATVAWLLLTLFPFTRFVHFWSAPVWYLSRPFVLYRRRKGEIVLSPSESRLWRTFGRLNRGPKL